MTKLRMYQPSSSQDRPDDPVVITGIGMVTAVGDDRETVWRAVRQGKSGVRRLRGITGIPDDLLCGAPVDIPLDKPNQLKPIPLARQAAIEAVRDARVDLNRVDLDRFGCSISAHMGDSSGVMANCGGGLLLPPNSAPWWEQWFPNTTCNHVANRFGLRGPRTAHSVACASGLVEVLTALRTIRRGQADMMLAGSADMIFPLLAAGFYQMRVLANHDDPTQACRPFDVNRKGFVLGEGGAMFVLERMSHALGRGARIYAEITAGRMLAEAHHVTGLDQDSEALTRLITETLREADLAPDDFSYINAHGTGTEQNDVVETVGIRRAFGSAANSVGVSSTKSILGHLVNAAGSVELAITALALRDGFAPPTINLTDPDPACDLDYIPQVGRRKRFDNAMKLSVAFGGHLVCMTLRRWNDAATGFAYPSLSAA